MVPHQLPLVVKPSALVGHGDDLPTVPALLSTDASLISRNPQERGLARDGGVIVGVSLDDGIVGDFRKAARDETAEGVVVCVDVWTEELGDEVWFLMRGGAEGLGSAVGGVDS